MKAAFAKLLKTDPVQSSHVDFRAGGNGVPILTRASFQSTAGFQTMGLPGGNRPYPGGGANKTVLGSIRMGDDDGNAPASAIVGDVGEIFFPYRAPDRVYPERTFPSVGNNVFQPHDTELATVALLRRLGDQKFKAVSQQPFDDYAQAQRLARDLDEAARNASPADTGLARDIIRGIAAERRQQNEADYLRKMLDGGATPEAAQAEIQNVRNANAIQEARKIDDRQYQAKSLIQKIAASRGVTPMVREPLNQSQSIDNPQRSQAMSQAMGKPGEGFGTSALDVNRVSILPQNHKMRSESAQEAEDEAIAFSNALTGSGDQAKINLDGAASGYSMATLRGQERQQQIEMASEALASRLEALRQRATRVKYALASPVIGEDILNKVYNEKGKKAGDLILFTPETIQELNPLQVLLSINNSVQAQPNGAKALTDAVKRYSWGTPERPSPNLLKDLKAVAVSLNRGEQNVRIPFASATEVIPVAKLVDLLNGLKSGSADIRSKIEQGRAKLLGKEEVVATSSARPPPPPGGGAVRSAEEPAAPRGGGLARLIRTPNPDTLPELPGAGRTVVRRPDVLPASAAPNEVPPEMLTSAMVSRMAKEELMGRLRAMGVKVRKNPALTTMRKTLKAKLGL
jgi:hypothetical protein